MVNSQNSQDEQEASGQPNRHADTKIRLGTFSFSSGAGMVQQSDGVGALPFAEDCEECQRFQGRLKDICLGVGLDGRKKPPAASVIAFRDEHGIVTCKPAWDVSQPSRGLGDTIAKITHATGLDKVVGAVAKALGKKDCGCKKRQEKLNAAVPYHEDCQVKDPERAETLTRNLKRQQDSRRESYRKLVPHVPMYPRPKITDQPVPIPVEFTSEPSRHLAYHIYPRKTSDNWRWNIRQLLARIEMFNGVRSIGVALDDTTVPLDEVKAEFSGVRVDNWIDIPNQPMIGNPGEIIVDDGGSALLVEGQTFIPLLLTLPRGPGHVTFYAHAKGMRYQQNHITLRWASMMYRGCLDDWGAVLKALSQFPMTGCFKRYEDFDLIRNWRWHYSGTYFWFRNEDVFKNPNWARLHPNFTGQVEAWPANLFPAESVHCLFGDGAKHLYQLEEVAKWESLLPMNDLTFFREEVARGFTTTKWNALRQIHSRLARRIKEMGCRSVYEIGSGLGPFLLGANDAGLLASGMDCNPYARDFAISKGVSPNMYRLSDLSDAEIQPADCIVCVEVFEHIPDSIIEKALPRIAENCKWFYFTSTPHPDPFDAEWGHVNLKPPHEWKAIFERHGMQFVSDDAAVEPWGMIFRGKR